MASFGPPKTQDGTAGDPIPLSDSDDEVPSRLTIQVADEQRPATTGAKEAPRAALPSRPKPTSMPKSTLPSELTPAFPTKPMPTADADSDSEKWTFDDILSAANAAGMTVCPTSVSDKDPEALNKALEAEERRERTVFARKTHLAPAQAATKTRSDPLKTNQNRAGLLKRPLVNTEPEGDVIKMRDDKAEKDERLSKKVKMLDEQVEEKKRAAVSEAAREKEAASKKRSAFMEKETLKTNADENVNMGGNEDDKLLKKNTLLSEKQREETDVARPDPSLFSTWNSDKSLSKDEKEEMLRQFVEELDRKVEEKNAAEAARLALVASQGPAAQPIDLNSDEEGLTDDDIDEDENVPEPDPYAYRPLQGPIPSDSSNTIPSLPPGLSFASWSTELRYLTKNRAFVGDDLHDPQWSEKMGMRSRRNMAHAKLIDGRYGIDAQKACAACTEKGRRCRVYHPRMAMWPNINNLVHFGIRCADRRDNTHVAHACEAHWSTKGGPHWVVE
ncbi:hypothetical protein CC80DRAFT_254236 [Byssothecium circinans]|uniref:Uncharacterized protein n=1 Tax=Byssothecium circinans TaxID=147558 RepID=A0A6A5TBZ7_9PLEO|nr:hypothetical protein CC80DRAFT_254236 [Byssothecium circinans]